MTPVPRNWHPYVLDEAAGQRRFIQGRAADLCGPEPTCSGAGQRSAPGSQGPAAGPVHKLDPAAIPAEGLRVERRAMLARATAGEPVLWTQRRRQPLSAPPVTDLRFDVLRAARAAP